MNRPSAWGVLRLVVIPALLIACSKPSSSPSLPGGDAHVTSTLDAALAPAPVDAAAPAPADAAVAAAAPDASVAPAPAPGSMALIVSFYSPGNGTDLEAYERLQAIVRDTRPSPARTSRPWGREGEHDECFTLGELTPAARKEFIARVRREVGTSKRVTILLDEPCRAARE